MKHLAEEPRPGTLLAKPFRMRSALFFLVNLMLYTALPASAGCRKEVARLASHAPIVLTLKEAQDAYWQILQRNLPRIAIDTKPLLPIPKKWPANRVV